ncbi:hypothetical protein QU24_24380 [Pantoea rodasii]|uniref:Uncharacterized protein n=1 Tax=Pantoea rodasii TaxID=1076549 RepID=A0A0B1QXE7_9GAMM|nr:hypothetical protein [Pantoea rodasii]KHJ65473.1 hypothetical protein QU24_24380 [Pantoea rodasii]
MDVGSKGSGCSEKIFVANSLPTFCADDCDREPEDLVLYALYSGRKYLKVKVKAFLEHLQRAIADLQQD